MLLKQRFMQGSDDYLEDLPEKVVNKVRGPRSSVSAEAFGTWNLKSAFVAQIVAKTDEVKSAIRAKLD